MISVYQKPHNTQRNKSLYRSESLKISIKSEKCIICLCDISFKDSILKCVKCDGIVHFKCLMTIMRIKKIISLPSKERFICELCYCMSEYLIPAKAKCFFCNCSINYMFIYRKTIFQYIWLHLHCYNTYMKYKNKLLSLFILKEKCLLCNKQTKERMIRCSFINCKSKIHYCCYYLYSIDKFKVNLSDLIFDCERLGIQSHSVS